MTLRRPHIMLLSVLLACMVAPAAPAAEAAGRCANASASPSSVSRKTAVRATACLLNRERGARGLRKLRLNGRLSRAAVRHARDMVRRHYFSHVSPSGGTLGRRIRRTGYLRRARSWWVGENIAWGSGVLATPGAIVRAWMNSPGHRANVLDRHFREMGLGVVRASPHGTGVNTFGYRR
ncbi:MAG TPA: CAP domain-containing protein [Thermoleophilaceae bacterium]|nr:CAP domain-containing protein [Thermoleophilaceae bacterium]